MLIAIVLDMPLAEAKALVDEPAVVITPRPIPQPVAPVAVKNLAPLHTCSFSKLLEPT